MKIIDKIDISPAGSVIYIIFLIAAIVFASFFGGLLPYVILYGILLLIPVSIAYIVVNFIFLQVYQELNVHRLVKGDRHVLSISMENTGLLPIHDMELVLYLDRCTFSGLKEDDTVSLKVHEKIKITARTTCLYAGVYNIGLKGVRLSDAFRILSITFNVPYSFRAIVSPRITDIANSYLDIENIINSFGSKSETRKEEIPGNDLRAYYPGDPLSGINWKVSARFDKLTVRVPDKLDTRTVSVFIEPENVPEKDRDTEYIKRRDHFLEFAVSSAYYFAGRGIPVRLVYPAGKITEKTIDSYEGFLGFYNDLSSKLSYRSEDEYLRMHKLIQERRAAEGENETRVFILEEASGREDFCIVAD